jgi:hypothetical protein
LVLTNGRIIEKQPQIIPREMGGERRKVQGEKKEKRLKAKNYFFILP